MLGHYFAALFGLGQARGLAQKPASPTDTIEAAAPADALVAAGPSGSCGWEPCPCGQWGVCREDRHGCVALCMELFPRLDQELDAWEAEHGWLYR